MTLLFTGCRTFSLETLNPDGSPQWTTVPPRDSKTLYGVGMAKLADQTLSRLKAETLAKDDIARQASTLVDSALVMYMQDAGEIGGDSQALELFENLSVQITEITLRGVQKEQIWVAPDGTVWIICSYPTKNLKDAYRLQTEAFEQKVRLLEAQKTTSSSRSTTLTTFSSEEAMKFLEAELEKIGL